MNNLEKTLRLLNILSAKPAVSQRTLASQSGISVGLVNLILKRLISTGHIKISNLNKKRVRYILTTKGLVEKTRQSYSYISNTIQVFRSYNNRLSRAVDGLIEKGHTQFVIQGKGEIAHLLELTLRMHPQRLHYRWLAKGEKANAKELVLDCRFKEDHEAPLGVVLMSELLTGSASK